ncbi:MAG: hypothetical protein ACYCSF_08435 [Acidimicrobiales bacterium]
MSQRHSGFYGADVTRKSEELLGQLRHLVPGAILIGGWGTWLRVKTEKSHDIDLIVDHEQREAIWSLADTPERSPTTHIGGRKWRATIEKIHVDLYLRYESQLGREMKLRVEHLTTHTESLDGWQVLDAPGHTATKLAALTDRPETLPGEKDRVELAALVKLVEPSILAERLSESSLLSPDELRTVTTQGLTYLDDLDLGRVERRLLRGYRGEVAGALLAARQQIEGHDSTQ